MLLTGTLQLTSFNALVLGLTTAPSTGNVVTFNSTFNWSVPVNNTLPSNAYDAVGTMEHEISELMGRSANAGYDGNAAAGTAGNPFGTYNVLDFYRYTLAGARAEPFTAGYDPSAQTYFALNAVSVNGPLSLAMEVYPNWLPTASGVAGAGGADVVDWGLASGDPYGSTTAGVAAAISLADIAALNTLGFTSVACFAAGTRIALADGTSRTVEALRMGDAVRAASGESLNIVWTGYRSIDCAAHPHPEKVWPVRIRPGAFGAGMPETDVFLSPDHAVWVEGVLVPVRLLLNGGTIVRAPVDQVTYHHVELERHAVILAEGLPAESYLDTGNRGMFANAQEPMVLHPDLMAENDQARRATGSCAPLVCDPEGVEPIWRRLAGRAGTLACPPPGVDDPELVITVNGERHAPISREDGVYLFVLPQARGEIRLVSRAAVPSAARPWMDDTRRLGVMVLRITVRSAAGREDIALDGPCLADGWWLPERDHATLWRWTNGDAVLPITGDSVAVEIWEEKAASPPVAEPGKTRAAA